MMSVFSSKFVVAVVAFVILIVLREVWHIAMAFYNAKQVRSIVMEGWYQWSLHGGRLSMMRRLGILFSLISLYEEHGVEELLPGFNLLVQKEIVNLMAENQGISEEELVQITDRLFRRISKIRNSEVVEAKMV